MTVTQEGSNERVISRYSMLSLYLPALIFAFGTGIATPAIPVLAKSFDISFGTAALVIVVHAAGSACATLPTGLLIDRIGRKKILIAGPILAAISSFLILTAHSFPELLVYRFIAGWAAQMWMMSRIVIIADTGGNAQRGRQISGMAGMDSVGKLLGPAVGGFSAALWGIQAPFIMYGVLSLLAIVPSFRLVRETAPARSVRRSEAKSGAKASLVALFTFPLLMLFLARALESLVRGARQGGTLDLYAVYAYDVGPAVIGVMGTLAGVFGVPIIFTAGYLMDRYGRKATLVPGFSLLGVSYTIMALTAVFHLSIYVFILSFLAVSVSQSITGGNMQTLGSDMAPPDARGKFMGVYNFISQTGQTVSPVMFAFFAGAFGYPASFIFLAVCGTATAIVLGTQVKETLRKEPKAVTVPISAEEAPAKLS